jgi:hypothetical protein
VRIPVSDMRATLDILRKSGVSDAGYITGWGFSATWDWPAWFVRLARDPYQNFSAQSAWRLAGGVRFQLIDAGSAEQRSFSRSTQFS